MKGIFTLLLILNGAQCLLAQSENEVIFTFNHKAANNPLELESTIFPIWNNKMVLLNRAAFYISEIELMRADSTTVPLKDVYLLVNAGEKNPNYPAGAWPIGEIIGVTLHLGVDSAHNHLDPSTYPPGHPLAHQKYPMHWGWLAGYRFMIAEGMVDNNSDGIPESDLQIHNIGDTLYQTVHLKGNAQAKDGTLQINIDLDYSRLFQDLSMSGNLIEHGADPDNIHMMENAATKGFLKIVQTTSSHSAPVEDFKISLTPNPASTFSRIQFEVPGDEHVSICITNMFGQTVRSTETFESPGTYDLDVSALPGGVYACALFRKGQILGYRSFLVIH